MSHRWTPKYDKQTENDRFWCQKCRAYIPMTELVLLEPQKLICKDCYERGTTSPPTHGGEQ